MLRFVDTSYVIVRDRDSGYLCAYYDLRGILDNGFSLARNLVNISNKYHINDTWDLDDDDINDLLVWIFKEDESRFLLIKGYPLDGGGVLSEEDLRMILLGDVEGYLINNRLYEMWYNK